MNASVVAFKEIVSFLLLNTASMWCVALLELQVVRPKKLKPVKIIINLQGNYIASKIDSFKMCILCRD